MTSAIKQDAAKIGETAARLLDADKDGKLTAADAKYAAAQMYNRGRAWVDAHDDMIEGPYNSAMRSIRIQSWPGHAWWGWLFTWPLGVLTWLFLALLLIWLVVPRPSLAPVAGLAGDIHVIRTQMTQVGEIAGKVDALERQTEEALRRLDELQAFTESVKKTKLFRDNPAGGDWAKQVFGGGPN